MKNKHTAVISAAILVIIGISLFLFAGKSPVIVEDEDIGYLYQANQSTTRFGNIVYYNEFHQRSDALMENPDYRILMLGDSITNGGTLVDQSETISELLENKLNEYFAVNGEVLSASAKGWNTENEYAYLKKFGTFGADLVILQLETNDLPYEDDKLDAALENIKGIVEICRKNNASLLILLVPQRGELEAEENIESKNKLISFLVEEGIESIDMLEEGFRIKKEHYRDNFHPNAEGNEFIAEILPRNLVIK